MPDSSIIPFSERLRSVRTVRGIKQTEAAQALGISHALLSHYEKGIREPGLDFIRRAGSYYGVSTDYLLGLADVNVFIPTAGHASLKKSFEETLDMITALYSVLEILDSTPITEAATEYVCSTLYRLFRPLSDVHGIAYDTDLIVNSDTFSLCSAAAMISESTVLMLLRSLPEETITRARQTSLADAIPINIETFRENLKKIDRYIANCNPGTHYFDSRAPLDAQ